MPYCYIKRIAITYEQAKMDIKSNLIKTDLHVPKSQNPMTGR